MGIRAEIPQEGRGGCPCCLTRVTRFSPKPGLSVSKDSALTSKSPISPAPLWRMGPWEKELATPQGLPGCPSLLGSVPLWGQ